MIFQEGLVSKHEGKEKTLLDVMNMFSFDQLSWQDGGEDFPETGIAIYDFSPFDARLFCTRHEEKSGKIIYQFQLQDTSGEDTVKATLHLDFEKTTTASLVRRKEADHLGKGMGKVLYEKVLDFIRHEVTQEGTSTTHVVSARPDVYTNDQGSSMSMEAWHGTFDDLLDEHGYTPEDAAKETWYKEYYPDA